MIFKRIEDRCEQQDISLKELLTRIPLSANGYYAAKRNNDIKISTLKKIADLLDTPLEYFLTTSGSVGEPGAAYITSQQILDKILSTTLDNNTMLRQITGQKPPLVKGKTK